MRSEIVPLLYKGLENANELASYPAIHKNDIKVQDSIGCHETQEQIIQ